MSARQVLLEVWCLAKRKWLCVLEAVGMGALLLLWAVWLGAMAGMFMAHL